MPGTTSHAPSAGAQTVRRPVRIALAAAATVALVLGLGAAVVPAAVAAPAALTPATILPSAAAVNNLVVVPGKNQVTATWASVPGATSYQLQVARSASMAGATSVTTDKTTAAVTGLKTPVTYYVRVVAGDAASAIVKTKTSKATTGRGTVTGVSGGGANAVQVTWARFAVGTSIDVRMSWDNTPLVKNQKSKYVQVTGLPITATSTVLTIPDGWQRLVGSTTGNPVYIRLIPHNGPRSRNGRIAYGWSGSADSYGTNLRVATFNITGQCARQTGPVPDWSVSRGAVVNSIRLAAPDILLVQELSRCPATINGQSVPQDQDLNSLLSDQWSVAWNQQTTAGQTGWPSNEVYYRTSSFDLIDSGQVQLSSLISADWTKNLDRFIAWAQLRVKATGEVLFAVSIHPERDDASINRRQLRRDQVRAMNAYIAQLNPRNYPVIVGGDFNVSFSGVIASGFADAPQDMVDAGFVSAASANTRTNMTRSSSNGGFPSKPKRYAYVGSRIDYLFLKNTAGAVSYTNQLVLNPNGTFNTAYYGSDHNLQWAQISLG